MRRRSGGRRRVERDCRWEEAKEANDQEQRTPNIPAGPEMEQREAHEEQGKHDRGIAVSAGAQRAKDVAAVELRGGEKIERSGEQPDPRGAADGMEQQAARGHPRMQQRREKPQN